MDSDDERESFQVTEDDLYNEFNPRRRRGRFTKEDAIYGMWAEKDSDDEGSRSGRRSDYSRPVDFVKADDSDEGEESDNEDIDAQVDYVLDSFEEKKLQEPGVDTGMGNFKTASLEKNRELHMFQTDKPATKRQGNKLSQPRSLVEKRKKELMVSDRDWGKWERHTTGFGSKMLRKFGYVPGKGLGKGGGGIVNPVKAYKHKELGQTDAQMSSVAEDVEEMEEQEEFQQQLHQWQKTDAKTPRPSYVFRTVDELKESSKKVPYKKSDTDKASGSGAGGIFGGGESSVKVIDLTGKEARVLNSYDDWTGMKQKTSAVTTTDDDIFLPNLLRNLDMLVEQTEDEILKCDRRFKHNQDMLVNMTYERNRLDQLLGEEEVQISRLTEIVQVVDMFERRLTGNSQLTLSECEDMLSDLQQKYPTEYKQYKLSSLAVAAIFPLIKGGLQTWDLLHDPAAALDLFHKWRELLKEAPSSNTVPDPESMDPYDRLVWEVWMPRLRQALSSWSPRTQSSVVVDLLEMWMPLLPDWILSNVLECLVLPRLQEEVDNWNPLTDEILLHSWIHPWLPLLEKQLEVVYPTIRHKFRSALNNWQPNDSSAHVILLPWAKVFTPEVMEAFLIQTVLPKLSYTLQTLTINPQQQNIAPVQWVLAWRDMIPVHHFVNIFNSHFFPKWLQVLAHWLTGSPNYEEVIKWYTGWKGMFDEDMLADPCIKGCFNRALALLDHAASGTLVPGMKENMVFFTTSERRKTAQVLKPPPKVVSQTLPTQSFKDFIEKKAEEQGILFLPTQKRYEGKLLYQFGSCTVYIDRGVLFLLRDKKWVPISIDSLIEAATT